MSYNYVATAQKPTAVSHSVVGHFTQSNDLNLIVSKTNRIEIYTVTPEGLQPLVDVGIYGRIVTMWLFRPAGESQDFLFLGTERNKFCILSYDSNSSEIQTKASGDLSDRVGRPCDSPLGIFDPEGRMFAFHLIEGQLKVIPIEGKGQLRQAFSLRLEEQQILDIQFLHGTKRPTFAVLFMDTHEQVHVKSYEVLVKEKELGAGPISLSNVEQGAKHLIALPKPTGGILVIGDQTIMHSTGSSFKTISMDPSSIRAWEIVDDKRYLLGDLFGKLKMLILEKDEEGRILNMTVEELGTTSIPATISYLDNSVIYIGSEYGDSQLIRMASEKSEENSEYLEELDRFNNLGPILDLCVVDLERQGQGQVVTCSGAFKDGSLRVIRNGVGINEQATSELPGIKGLWSLKPSDSSAFDKFIILSFVGETRILAITGDELEETLIAGFQAEEQTIFSGNVGNDQIVQITNKSIQLVDLNSFELISSWSPNSNSKINAASCNKNQILLATGGGNLVYLQVKGNKIEEVKHVTLENEIACVNIRSGEGESNLCAVGMWTDISVRLLLLPTLEQVGKELLGGEIIPRSVLLASFEGLDYLLCALGDGNLFSFSLEKDGRLTDRKKISLGTQPVVLSTFKSNGNTHVFASSDRPTVIYSSNKKLLFSNVNLKEVNHMAPFNSENFPDSIALATDEVLTIGTIDDIQKLHVKTIPLNEAPSRISYQKETSSFAVLTMKPSSEMGEDLDNHFVKLIDASTFEILHSFALSPRENGVSITSLHFDDDSSNTEYYAVGTAFVLAEESEPKRGRILILSAVEGKLKLVTEVEVKGAVYAIKPFNGKLVAGVNSKVQIWKFEETAESLQQLSLVTSNVSSVLVYDLVVRGDFIIVADLMRSISLLLYKPTEEKIEEIARDYAGAWMTATESLDDESFIGSDIHCNLFTVKRNAGASTEDERSRLNVHGMYHLGEQINKIKSGSLVMKGETEGLSIPTLIYGTVSGSIGIIGTLTQEQFTQMEKVQNQLTKTINGVGGFKHNEWRSFHNDRKTVDAKNFLDGDLIESFLDLPSSRMSEVSKALEISTEEICREIETLQRAIH